jgi:hypothetical protein
MVKIVVIDWRLLVVVLKIVEMVMQIVDLSRACRVMSMEQVCMRQLVVVRMAHMLVEVAVVVVEYMVVELIVDSHYYAVALLQHVVE